MDRRDLPDQPYFLTIARDVFQSVDLSDSAVIYAVTDYVPVVMGLSILGC